MASSVVGAAPISIPTARYWSVIDCFDNWRARASQHCGANGGRFCIYIYIYICIRPFWPRCFKMRFPAKKLAAVYASVT